jgi:hypothetical protein
MSPSVLFKGAENRIDEYAAVNKEARDREANYSHEGECQKRLPDCVST